MDNELAGPVEPPLCVDLDGTLIADDTLLVSLRMLARRQPWRLIPAARWVMGGRAAFKAYVAGCILPDAGALPWRAGVIAFLRAEHARGRRLILATAADHRVARCVADHLGIFDAVIATEGRDNRRGNGKLLAIRNLLDDKDFDYVGDSSMDIPLFLAARRIFLVAPSASLLRRVGALRTVDGVLEG